MKNGPAGVAPSRRLGFGAAALLVAVGCQTLRPGDPAEQSMVIFTNESDAQATLYGSTSGTAGIRIGVVAPGRTDTLRIPQSLSGRGGLNFYADLLARSGRPSTGTISITRGDWLSIRLPPTGSTLIVLPAP